jgi:lipoprotein-releasing system ATP-binding protein
MPMIATGLGHRYPGRPWLFRGLTLEFEHERVYAVTGPSGSGKSTLLALLAGWLAPTEGTVTRPEGERVAWVFQNPYGVARRSARDHVSYPYLARGATPGVADRAAQEMLERFGLGSLATSEFRSLSGGEAQRLMFARAAAGAPPLLLVDEPTAQLDPISAATVNAVIGELAARGSVVVVATHDPATRAACTDHIDLSHHVALDKEPELR